MCGPRLDGAVAVPPDHLVEVVPVVVDSLLRQVDVEPDGPALHWGSPPPSGSSRGPPGAPRGLSWWPPASGHVSKPVEALPVEALHSGAHRGVVDVKLLRQPRGRGVLLDLEHHEYP